MSSRRARPRLRIRVDDDPAMVWDIGPDDIVPPVDPRWSANPIVREASVGAADRAAGIRRFEVMLEGWTFDVSVDTEVRARLRERATQEAGARLHHGPISVRAPMTGRVVRIWVAEGDTVEAGQRLLAVEAMKMENEVRAPRAGILASLVVAVDDSVEHGDELVTVR